MTSGRPACLPACAEPASSGGSRSRWRAGVESRPSRAFGMSRRWREAAPPGSRPATPRAPPTGSGCPLGAAGARSLAISPADPPARRAETHSSATSSVVRTPSSVCSPNVRHTRPTNDVFVGSVVVCVYRPVVTGNSSAWRRRTPRCERPTRVKRSIVTTRRNPLHIRSGCRSDAGRCWLFE